MSSAQPHDVPSGGLLDLVTPPERPASVLASPVAASDAEAEAELPSDHLEIQTDFSLDSEGWKAWLEIIDSPPRDLPGLRAFLTEPIQCMYE